MQNTGTHNEYSLQTGTCANFKTLDVISYYYFFLDPNFIDSSKTTHFNNHPLLTPIYSRNTNNEFPDSRADESSPAPAFLHIRQSTVISFFVDNLVDVPVCFKKSKSLYALTFELQSMKCINFLTRHGKKEQMFKFFNRAVDSFVVESKHNLFAQSTGGSWSVLYRAFLSFTVLHTELPDEVSDKTAKKAAKGTSDETADEAAKKAANELNAMLTYQNSGNRALLFNRNFYHDDHVYFNPTYFTHNIFFNLIKAHAPVFTFYIRKVDKKIRKNSRGKSGKYVIVWKYIPEYKRFYLALRWFLKDLKFQKDQTLVNRMIKGIYSLFNNPNQNFLVKLRKFSHIFVFQNFKKTLMRTLRAAS